MSKKIQVYSICIITREVPEAATGTLIQVYSICIITTVIYINHISHVKTKDLCNCCGVEYVYDDRKTQRLH